MALRRLGIYGENLPTKKSKVVEPSDFFIGGLIGFFERRFQRTFVVRNSEELREIFGDNIVSTYYGWDAAQGFFDNVVGIDAKLFVKSHVGNTGSAIDGVVATDNAVDGAAANVLQIDSAYQEKLDYSTSGNRTGYTITNGSRFTTAVATAGSPSDTSIAVDSVSGMRIGDIVKVVATGGGGATVYKKITGIDESAGTISFSGAFDATAFVAVDDVVTIPGFQIKTYRQSTTGIVSEVDVELGKIWCTTESEVTDFFVESVFSTSKWIKITDLDPVTAIDQRFPIDVSAVTYLTGGSNGSSPTTTAQWNYDLQAFNDDPIRLICNAETTDESIQKAIETYCRGRDDTPLMLYNIPEDQTKTQLIEVGNKFQRSDDVLGVIVANWLEKDDPFATSVTAPKRKIPNVGHVMGLWLRGIGTLGIHYIPAVPTLPIFGITGVVGEQFLNDLDRTDLADAGINVIQFVTGSGILVRNWFTPSTTKEFQFGNGIFMRNFIKISVIDSLSDTVNEPNNFARIQASKDAVTNFFYSLWRTGSTGNVPEGETFGQTINPDTGVGTVPADHFQIQADLINNPQSSIENGERNIDSWFTYPAPASSVKIGVGLMLLG
jgi:hypothetical protein